MFEPTFERRGFLRALTAIPLLGGGIKLFGEPTSAAVPISPALLRKYAAFLNRELFATWLETRLIESPWHFTDMGYSLSDSSTWRKLPLWWPLPDDPACEALVTRTAPSSRAAVVLGAAGVSVGKSAP